MDSMSTQKPSPNVSRRSRAEPQGHSRCSLVTHLVAHSQQFLALGHLQAFAASYSSEHRFCFEPATSSIPGTRSFPDSGGALR